MALAKLVQQCVRMVDVIAAQTHLGDPRPLGYAGASRITALRMTPAGSRDAAYAAQAKLDKLDAVLAQSFTSRQDAALLAEMLLLPNDGRYPIPELTPQHRRQKTMEAVTAQMEALSRSNPLLMIFEDAHWIDPTSLEALGLTVDRLIPILTLSNPWLPSRGVRWT